MEVYTELEKLWGSDEVAVRLVDAELGGARGEMTMSEGLRAWTHCSSIWECLAYFVQGCQGPAEVLWSWWTSQEIDEVQQPWPTSAVRYNLFCTALIAWEDVYWSSYKTTEVLVWCWSWYEVGGSWEVHEVQLQASTSTSTSGTSLDWLTVSDSYIYGSTRSNLCCLHHLQATRKSLTLCHFCATIFQAFGIIFCTSVLALDYLCHFCHDFPTSSSFAPADDQTCIQRPITGLVRDALKFGIHGWTSTSNPEVHEVPQPQQPPRKLLKFKTLLTMLLLLCLRFRWWLEVHTCLWQHHQSFWCPCKPSATSQRVLIFLQACSNINKASGCWSKLLGLSAMVHLLMQALSSIVQASDVDRVLQQHQGSLRMFIDDHGNIFQASWCS